MQVYPEQFPQDCDQTGFEYLQGRKLHNLSEQFVSVISQPQCDEVFSLVEMNLPVFLSATLCPVTETT